ncbi:MAG: acyl carrier protein [Dehalococcoidales bacterium]|nr:acyl carrier protein [Dehalococcoidales bacterium]
MADIWGRLKGIIVERLGVDEGEVVASAHLIDDLGADSIELVELAMAVEEEFSTPDHRVEIPDDDLAELVTVQDVVGYLGDLGVGDN